MAWMTVPARNRLRAGSWSVSRVVLNCPFALLPVKTYALLKVLIWIRVLAIFHHAAVALTAFRACLLTL